MSNKKLFVCLAIILASIFLFCSFSNVAIADSGARLSFADEPSYELRKETKKAGRTIGWVYSVDVFIQNSGNAISQYTSVYLRDEEGFELINNTYIYPGETKTISFTWSTISEVDQNIEIEYKPEDKDATLNENNKDSIYFTLIVGSEDIVAATSTPGFELFIFIFAVISIILARYHKKK